MAEFMGDLVVLLAMVLLAAGLWHLDTAKRDSRGTPAKLGAWVLILAGIGGGLCASSYMWKFRAAGDFERAYPPALLQAHDMEMMQKMMMDKMMPNGGAPQAAPKGSPDEHAAHHPDAGKPDGSG